ncbi:hypothetical protein MMYC01_206103 [Madurella mycetomatis]|uniref:GH16 domain-containing protein n=1 Tax=Madurella mycetomatis TaxID=100816 RepID=A0A175W003_9PEZI|nr:hypothetical protein MMYC01_206103 [Madurella mycetomatis]
MFWLGPAFHLAVMIFVAASVRAVTNSSDYILVDVFDETNFFEEFEFFDAPDPTHGFVNYVSAEIANRDGLAGYSQGGIYLGVDYTNPTTTGRPSVRVTSKKTFTKGLFIADIAHMPAGSGGAPACGIWPAFWTFGYDWPDMGEIDIIEGVNTQSTTKFALHTREGCSLTASPPGNDTSYSYSYSSPSPSASDLMSCEGNVGCTQVPAASAPESHYGAAFNAAGGGVYAMEWTDEAIRLWFFPRGGAFNPLASANSTTHQDHFADHNIVFDTTFCGDWAGSVWAADPVCSALAPTCEEYVGANPEVYREAYWLVNELRIYQIGGGFKAGPGAGAGTRDRAGAGTRGGMMRRRKGRRGRKGSGRFA